jgi:hypothetical protein
MLRPIRSCSLPTVETRSLPEIAMLPDLYEIDGRRVLECAAEGPLLRTAQDTVDLIGEAKSAGANLVVTRGRKQISSRFHPRIELTRLDLVTRQQGGVAGAAWGGQAHTLIRAPSSVVRATSSPNSLTHSAKH